MSTRLEKPLKREIDLDGVLYTVTFSPQGIKIVEKGKRKGQEVSWGDLIAGRVALAHALADSVALGEDQAEGS